MVAHRKNVPPRKAYVPSSWFIVLTVMLLIGGAGWLGWLLVDDPSSETAAPPAMTPTASATPSEPAESTSEPEPDPTPEPTTEPTPEAPAVEREALVSVLNNSGVVGAARTFSVRVTEAGWTLGGVGNWTGSIPSNTVYYPQGLQEQAELLGEDVGITRIMPSVAPMRTDRLTVILSGPQ